MKKIQICYPLVKGGDKTKSNSVIITVLGLGGFIVYDKVMQDNALEIPSIENDENVGANVDVYETFRSNMKNNLKNNTTYNLSLFSEFTQNGGKKYSVFC